MIFQNLIETTPKKGRDNPAGVGDSEFRDNPGGAPGTGGGDHLDSRWGLTRTGKRQRAPAASPRLASRRARRDRGATARDRDRTESDFPVGVTFVHTPQPPIYVHTDTNANTNAVGNTFIS